MRFGTAVALTTGLALQFASGTITAHHSFASEFDSSQAITVHGVVVSVEMTNPHSFIYLDVKTGGGVERWALEGPAAIQVARRGVDNAFVKAGDELGACGYVARSGVAATRAEPATGRAARKLQAAVLSMPDGQNLLWNNYRQGKCGLDR